MSQQLYQLVVKAAGEVRDAEGNLVEPVTAEHTEILTADELVARGFTIPKGDPS